MKQGYIYRLWNIFLSVSGDALYTYRLFFPLHHTPGVNSLAFSTLHSPELAPKFVKLKYIKPGWELALVRVFFSSHWLLIIKRGSSERKFSMTLKKNLSRYRFDESAWEFQAKREWEFELSTATEEKCKKTKKQSASQLLF